MSKPVASFTLGYFTAALPQKPLEQQVEWASAQGYEALELAAWPVGQTQEERAAGHLDVRRLSAKPRLRKNCRIPSSITGIRT